MKAKKTLSRHDQLVSLTEQVNDKLGAEGKVYLGRDIQVFERVPSGVLAFDAVSGGGLPRRLYTELYGRESSGKTTLALHMCAAVQRQGGNAAWVVGEEFDDDWAAKNGVDVDRLLKIEALTGDLMLEAARTYLEAGLLDVLVIDSIQAVGTKRENDAGIEKETYAGGGAPQMWGRFYRATRALFNAGRANTAIIGISQVRDPIGVFSPSGKPEPTPTQISVIKHWKSISVYCKRGEPVYLDPKSEKKRIISREFKLQCKKNKTAVPERVSSYVYNYTKEAWGIDRADAALRLATVYGLVRQKGATLEGYGIKVKGSKETPSREAFLNRLREDESAVEDMETDILAAMGGE